MLHMDAGIISNPIKASWKSHLPIAFDGKEEEENFNNFHNVWLVIQPEVYFLVCAL